MMRLNKKGRWITAHSRLEQVDDDTYELLDNELYEDVDGTLYLAPRLLLTDNFSRPFGNKQKYDVRPPHIHDIGCRYKQLIKVNVTLDTLVMSGKLRKKDGEKIVLDDVPTGWLTVIDVKKFEVDNLFKRMCEATNMPKNIVWLYRCGVFCNVGWLWSGKNKIEKDNIFKFSL